MTGKQKIKKWLQEQQRKEAEELMNKLKEAKEEVYRKRKEHEQTR